MQLSKKTIEWLHSTEALRCRNKLALELGKSQYTITRYINDNDIILTTAKALSIISEESGKTNQEILVEETAKV